MNGCPSGLRISAVIAQRSTSGTLTCRRPQPTTSSIGPNTADVMQPSTAMTEKCSLRFMLAQLAYIQAQWPLGTAKPCFYDPGLSSISVGEEKHGARGNWGSGWRARVVAGFLRYCTAAVSGVAGLCHDR